MAELDALTDEQLAVALLGPALETITPLIGAARLPRVLLAAAVRLAIDVEGEARGWEILRALLADATEQARKAAHPRPRPAG